MWSLFYLCEVNLQDTIVAVSTPPGEGALAIIRISGPEAIAYSDEIFVGAKLVDCKSHTIHFGRIQDRDQSMLDEVVCLLFKGPHSYTAEDVVEINCHGSGYIVQRIIELYLDSGARLASPGEFTQRAFLNGRMDLSQAEAVADLIASKSAAAHKMAIDQMRGGFSGEIKILRQKLIDFASLMELELDFAEEDVEFANRKELMSLVREISKKIASLIKSFRLGNVIKEGITSAIVGRPNAGKSTLLNRLLAEDRAIVSDIPGTTRDTVEEILNINGVQFRLVDTAGLREATDQIEEMGVEKSLKKIKAASIVLFIFDASSTSAEELRKDIEALELNQTEFLVVANKMDRNPYAKAEEFISPPILHEQFVPISAKNNMNIDHLKSVLYHLAVGSKMNLEGVIVSNSRHVSALKNTEIQLQKILQGFKDAISSDFIAMDIRQAIYHLGEITGEISTDDLLDNIFRNFCIGK